MEKIIDGVQTLVTLGISFQDDESRLIPNKRIEQVLNQMVKKDWDGEYTPEMGDKRAWNKVKKAYEFFYDKIDTEYSDDVSELLNLLIWLKDVSVVEIIVDDETEAIATFERVNARGSHLQIYELIKAHLFFKSEKVTPEEFDGDVETEWQVVKNNTEQSVIDLEKMLSQFNFSKEGYTAKRKVYGNLKKQASNNLNRFIDELKDFTDFYRVLSIPIKGGDFKSSIREYLVESKGVTGLDHEDKLDKVARSLYALGFFKVVSVYPLIYSSLNYLAKRLADDSIDSKAKKKDLDAWVNFVDFLERFSFVTTTISHISALHGGKLSKIYTEYCREFSRADGDFRELMQKCIADFSEIKPAKTKFVADFIQTAYVPKGDTRLILYIFDKINRHSANKKQKVVHPGNVASILSIDGYERSAHNVEHILPQSTCEELKDAELVHNIGNLLAIHYIDNSKFGNKAPDAKVELLKKLTKKNEIQNKPYLSEFVSKYGSKAKKWDDKVILKRADDLAEVVYDIFKY